MEVHEKFVFEGVKPECTGGRFFHVTIDKENRYLTITEYGQAKFRKSFCEKIVKIYSVPVPAAASSHDDKIIGRVLCTGCHKNMLILQYITTQNKYIRFFIVDTDSSEAKAFKDTMNYFNRDFHAVAPLECLIDPDSGTVLLRLPQYILTSRSWSKVLQVDLEAENASHPLLSSHFDAVGTKNCCLRDRRFNNMAFHPRQQGVLIIVLVNEFCSKLKISLFDVVTKKTKLSKEVFYSEHDGLLLYQSNLSISKTGETACLCCLVAKEEHFKQDFMVKVMLLETESFEKRKLFSVPVSDVTLPLRPGELISPIFSRCGSRVTVWHLKKLERRAHPLGRVKLNENITLRSLCRVVIIQNTNTEDIASLPLPESLKLYLKFSNK